MNQHAGVHTVLRVWRFVGFETSRLNDVGVFVKDKTIIGNLVQTAVYLSFNDVSILGNSESLTGKALAKATLFGLPPEESKGAFLKVYK